MKTALTDLAIQRLKPNGKQQTVFCATTPNFGLRISQAGGKSFFVLTGQDRRRVHLGKWPATTLKDARIAARKLLLSPEDETASVTFSGAFETYLKAYIEPNYRERPAKEVERLIRKHAAPLMHRDLTDLSTADCTTILDRLMSRPSEANHFFSVLRTFFSWCERRKLIEVSPLHKLSKPAKETSRDRVLTIDELVQVYKAAQGFNGHFGTLLQLCILTGQRRGELAQAQTSWVLENLLVIPARVSKNGMEHVVPLTKNAQSLLAEALRAHMTVPPCGDGSQYIFAARGTQGYFCGWSASKVAFDKACPLTEPFVIHDLRRSLASHIDADPWVIEALLNHQSGVISKVGKIYNRRKYIAEARIALEAWDARLLGKLT